MDKKELQQIISDIRNIKSHLLIFDTAYPDIMYRASAATKAHLLVFRKSFLYLNRMVDFIISILPSLNKMMDLLPRQKDDIPNAAEKLGKVTETTEMATTEILDTVDNILNTLGDINEAQETHKSTKEKLGSVNDQLFTIMDALQFQDITSQQIESIKSTLSEINSNLSVLFQDFTKLKVEKIEVKHGTFDTKAAFNREESSRIQSEIDELFDKKLSLGDEDTGCGPEVQQEPVKEAEPEKEPEPAADENKTESASVSQDDIDALFSTKSAPAAETQKKEVKPEPKAAAKKEEPPVTEQKSQTPAASGENVSQDDIDAMFSSSPKEENKKEPPASEKEPDKKDSGSGPISQADIDAMFNN